MLVAAVVVPLVGCAQEYEDIKVITQDYTEADAELRATYAWAAVGAVVRDPDREWTPPSFDLAKEIKFLVDKELRAKGINLYEWSPEELAKYRAAVKAGWTEFATTPESKALLQSHIDFLTELGAMK